jgi:hypothetical protein
MLTLGRFRALAQSYGADLRRWPEEMRGEAEALLNVSGEARAVLDEARKLDAAIEAAGLYEDAVLWPPGEQEAALARLRSGVAARIASSSTHGLAHRRSGRMSAASGRWAFFPLHFHWVGLATGGGAILAGLLIGAMYASPSASDDVLTMLQPSPIHILAD